MSIKYYYECLVKISRVIYAFSNYKFFFNLNSKTIKILSKTSLAPKCPFFHNFYYLIFLGNFYFWRNYVNPIRY